MQVWRLAKQAFALDRQGTGARLSGGRWNSPGVAAIYAGLTPEITALEKLVHTGSVLPLDLVLLKLTLPEGENLYQFANFDALPSGWDAIPGSAAAIVFGDAFLTGGTRLGLIVPSAVMPEARNMVINPHHPEFSKISMEIIRPFLFDQRLRSGSAD